jgi:hypothetical protein
MEMKKSVLTALLLSMLFLFCLFYGFSAVNADITANDGRHLTNKPYIVFPSNTSYNSRLLILNVSFHAEIYGNIKYHMTYSLDGKENESVPLVEHYFGMFHQEKSYIDGSVVLPELSEGSHTITVYLECDQETWDSAGSHLHIYFDSQTVFFTILNTVLPTPTASPTPVITPSPELTPSPEPTPTLAPDLSPSQEPEDSEPFTTTLVIASTIPVAMVGVGLLFYFKKRKH